MRADLYRTQVADIEKKIAKLQGDKAKMAAALAQAGKRSSDALAAASRAPSASTAASKQREALRYSDVQAKAQTEMSKIDRQIADEHRKLVTATSRINDEFERERRRLDATGMTAEQYRRRVINHQQIVATLQLQKTKLQVKMAEALQKGLAATSAASEASTPASIANKQNEAIRYNNELSKRQIEIGRLETKLAEENRKLAYVRNFLDKALTDENMRALISERNLRVHGQPEVIGTATFVQDSENALVENEYRALPNEHDTSKTYEPYPHYGKFHVITGVNGTGKSRYLRYLVEQPSIQEYYKRIVCLAGTVYERFPLHGTMGNAKCDYLYFGNKTKGNILSERAPFRILADYMLGQGCNGISGQMAGQILEGLGFSSWLKIRFSIRLPTKTERRRLNYSARDLDITLELSNTLEQTYVTEQRLAQIRNDEIYVNDIFLIKNNRELGLSDLSSGERLYLLTTLALCFCVTERTLVLFDEPENSLHPQWQSKIVKDMVAIIESISEECTVVIATHSPLIISSAPNSISYIRDLPSSESWVKSELYGRNADSVLSEQFGIVSPRSLTVAMLIQECLSTLVDINDDPASFLAAVKKLEDQKIMLDEDDPLHSTLQRIYELQGKYS